MKLLIFLIATTLGAQTKDYNVNMRVLGTLDTTGSTATKPFRTVSSDQSGSCSVPNEAVLNSLNGKVFVCAVSTWAQISASGTPSFDPQAANRIFAGPATGADSVPAFRALVAADMPATYMPNTRLINTASPLGGGGALTGDLTLTCSTCIISSGAYGDPAWLTSLDASKVSGTLGTVTLTNGTGLPVSTGISGLGAGVATFLATPSSANLASAVTNETGTGALVFATDPTFTLTDVTTNNATTSQHGWLPKLGGGTSNFLRADGTWAAPSGSGDVVAAGTNTYTGYNNFSGGSMRWPETTIAFLPSASSNTGKVYVVTNAFSAATGCGTAGGSARVPCISDGSSWVPLSLVTTNGAGIASLCSGNTCTLSVQHAGVNAQTGTTYTIADSDRAKLITGTNASAQAYTLPQAGGSSQFVAGWFTDIQNRGAGTITITPTTSTIDGAATLALKTSQGARIFSDGTNYYTQRGVVSANNYTTTSYSATPTFTIPTGALSASFEMTLTGNVTSSTLSGAVAGQRITFKVCQDATGSRTFVWPTSVTGFPDVYGLASSCTTQAGVVNAAGNLVPDGQGVISDIGSYGQFRGCIAGLPPPAPPAGTIIFYCKLSDLSFHALKSDGTDTALGGSSGTTTCAAGGTTTATSPTALATVTFASGLAAGNMLRITTFWRHTGGTTNTPRMTITLGGSNIDASGNLSWAAATDTMATLNAVLHVVDTTHQRVQGGYFRSASWQNGAYWGMYNDALAVNVTSSVDLVINGYFASGSGETLSLDHYCVEKL